MGFKKLRENKKKALENMNKKTNTSSQKVGIFTIPFPPWKYILMFALYWPSSLLVFI